MASFPLMEIVGRQPCSNIITDHQFSNPYVRFGNIEQHNTLRPPIVFSAIAPPPLCPRRGTNVYTPAMTTTVLVSKTANRKNGKTWKLNFRQWRQRTKKLFSSPPVVHHSRTRSRSSKMHLAENRTPARKLRSDNRWKLALHITFARNRHHRINRNLFRFFPSTRWRWPLVAPATIAIHANDCIESNQTNRMNEKEKTYPIHRMEWI